MCGETHGEMGPQVLYLSTGTELKEAKRDVADIQGDTEKDRVEPWPPRALRPKQEPDIPKGRITRGKLAGCSGQEGEGPLAGDKVRREGEQASSQGRQGFHPQLSPNIPGCESQPLALQKRGILGVCLDYMTS